MGRKGRKSVLRPAELDNRKNRRVRARNVVEHASRVQPMTITKMRLRGLGAVDVKTALSTELVIPDRAELLLCVRDVDWHGWLMAQQEIKRLDYPLLVACSTNPEILAGVQAEQRTRVQRELLLPRTGELVATG